MGRVGAESGQSQENHSAELTQLSKNIIKLLKTGAKSKSEVAAILGFSGVTGHLNRSFKTLLNKGFIQYTIPGKPQSRLQKYMLVEKGVDHTGENKSQKDTGHIAHKDSGPGKIKW